MLGDEVTNGAGDDWILRVAGKLTKTKDLMRNSEKPVDLYLYTCM